MKIIILTILSAILLTGCVEQAGYRHYIMAKTTPTELPQKAIDLDTQQAYLP